MILKHKLQFNAYEKSFEFRTLHVDDVTEGYILALKSQIKYIEANPSDITIEWQQQYILNIVNSVSDTICGLFMDHELVGTSGIQNLHNSDKATIGIFILDELKRGMGLGKILLWSASYVVNKSTGIESFEAGIKNENVRSINTFKSCGYSIIQKNDDESMALNSLQNLKKPDLINAKSIMVI